MISQEEIKRLSLKQQTTELNIKREYFQHLFLKYFYQQPEANEIFFKGGTALRIIYGSPRFSEDLDFSSKSEVKTIESTITNSLREIERLGIKTEAGEAKTTSGGYLATVEFKIFTETIRIKFEIFQRNKGRGEPVSISSDFILSYILLSLDKKLLVEEKLLALIDRGKPRDFYDIYFLLRNNLISVSQKNKYWPEVLEKVKNSNFDFALELEQLLPQSHWLIIKDFKAHLISEMERR